MPSPGGLPPRPDWATALLAAEPSSASFTRVDFPGTGGFWVAVEDAGHASDAVLKEEMSVAAFFAGALAAARARDGGACRALDVGSNGGFFSLLARAAGCEVIAIDAQPRCLDRLQSAAALNGFSGAGLAAVWAAVGEGGGGVRVGATRCSGLWGVEGAGWIDAESARNATARVLPLAEAAAPFFEGARRVAALKVDAEGSEVAVLRGALPLLEARRVDAFVAEFAPRRTAEITPFAVVEDTLRRVYAAGYACRQAEGGPEDLPLERLLAHFAGNETTAGLAWVGNYLCQLRG